jgi:hypothetical protein
MPKRLNLLGQKFGMLTPISYNEDFKKWLCECDCGRETLREAFMLRRRLGKNKSCGCQAFNHGKRKPDNWAPKQRIWLAYKRGAERRKLEFTLSREEFLKLIQQNCHYCGSEPINKCPSIGYDLHFVYNGIDRIDNEKGYITDNCVPCCKICNQTKLDTSLEEWKAWIKKVYKHLFETN